MKVKNQIEWAQQETDLRMDGEIGEKFLAFFVKWFETAEQMIRTEEHPSTVGSVRRALKAVEDELGFLEPLTIGQMLHMAFMFWEYGEEMVGGMSIIEQRVMEWAVALKLAELQQEARQPIVDL